MTRSANSLGGVLHNVTMPRSWFITLTLPRTGLQRDTSTFFAFAETMIDLIQRIDAQAQAPFASVFDTGEQFTVDGGRMTNFTGPLHVARM